MMATVVAAPPARMPPMTVPLNPAVKSSNTASSPGR
jgi:hypothetical protein